MSDLLTATTKSLPVGFGKFKEFPYTSSSTSTIDFVMDVNGKHGPNSETRNNTYHDIRLFKAARFSKGCTGISIDGIGVDLGTNYECLAKGTDDFNKWDPNGSRGTSCWAGAKKACDNIDMELPDLSILHSVNHMKNKYQELLVSGKYFPKNDNVPDAVYVIDFDTGNNVFHGGSKSAKYGALCVGEDD